jgi:hypothetical protein
MEKRRHAGQQGESIPHGHANKSSSSGVEHILILHVRSYTRQRVLYLAETSMVNRSKKNWQTIWKDCSSVKGSNRVPHGRQLRSGQEVSVVNPPGGVSERKKFEKS